MRTFGTFFVAAIFACVAGCGGSSSSSNGRTGANGGQCPASSNGKTCTGEAAYQTCITNACGTQAKTCFGNNYASGDFSGSICADYMGCVMKCPCDSTATTCETSCSTQYLATTAGAACMSCVTTLGYCVAQSGCTQPVCTTTSTNTNTTTTTTTTTTTSTGTNCVALQTCCTKMTDATIKAACQGSITNAGGVDSTCALILQGIQSYCP